MNAEWNALSSLQPESSFVHENQLKNFSPSPTSSSEMLARTPVHSVWIWVLRAVVERISWREKLNIIAGKRAMSTIHPNP